MSSPEHHTKKTAILKSCSRSGAPRAFFPERMDDMEFVRSLIQACQKPFSGSLLAPAVFPRSWGVVARHADVTAGSGWAPLVPASSSPSAHPTSGPPSYSPIAANRPYPHRFPAIGSPTCSTYSGQPPSTSSLRPIPDLWKLDHGVCSPGPNNQQDSTFSRKVPAGSRTLVPRFLFRVSGTLQRFPLIR